MHQGKWFDSLRRLPKSLSYDTVTVGKGSKRPQRFLDSDFSEPLSKINVNGKRVMEDANSHVLDRPRVLDGLKSRKSLKIPQVVTEVSSRTGSSNNEDFDSIKSSWSWHVLRIFKSQNTVSKITSEFVYKQIF